MFHAWLTFRFITSGRRFLSLPSMLSLIGMTLGVACLVVAMGVVSGFEATLRESITDVFGHVLVISRSSSIQSLDSVLGRMKKAAPTAQAFTPFLQFEGVIAHDQKLSGVVVQGIDPESVTHVLNLQKRVVRGAFNFKAPSGAADADIPRALVGKGLEKKFSLKVGQTFQIVLPQPAHENSTGFSPKVQRFVLAGVLDLGKNDYNERYIVTDLKSAQTFLGVGDHFSGIRIRLAHAEDARQAALSLGNELGSSYIIMDWVEVNKNLFEALSLERVVIFLIVMVMVVSASFNISSQLFVSVLQRFSDISILKAIGCSPQDIRKIFTLQGLFFGMAGTFFGLVLGLILCFLFVVLQKFYVLLPGDIYKLDSIGVDIRFFDLSSIVLAAFLVCLISTVFPALRGSKLSAVEGLRYE
jgi:lipoprotein-releasing system permease protein